MWSRFFATFVLTYVFTLLALGSIGYGVTHFAKPVQRDPFRTNTFEFDLAPGWVCERDGTEHVCRPPSNPPYGAIAIIAMKERGPEDTLESYEATLRAAKSPGAQSADLTSPVRFVHRNKLGRHEWVEALREGSEVPNYNTYYLGTVTSHVGILVTMSSHKDREAEYVEEMNKMMSTLNVYEK